MDTLCLESSLAFHREDIVFLLVVEMFLVTSDFMHVEACNLSLTKP